MFGIEVVADYSLLIIFALVATNLAFGALPRWHPDWGPLLVGATAMAAAVLLFVSIVVHELAHALVARGHGLPVYRITLFAFGGMAHIGREPPTPRAELLIAIVGPLTSLVIGGLAMLGGGLLVGRPGADSVESVAALRELGPLATLLLWLGPLNIALAIFNMVPGFPLDGGRVLRALIWWGSGDLHKATQWASALGQAFGWFLVTAGIAMIFGYAVPALGEGMPQGLWLVLIGWFLSSSARASAQQMEQREVLASVAVRDVMRSRMNTVPPDLSLAAFVRDYVMNEDQPAFPVTRDGSFLGIIRWTDLRNIPRERWETMTVAEVMRPASEVPALSPDEEASHALQDLADHELLPVIDHDKFVGAARREDLAKWLALHPRTTAS